MQFLEMSYSICTYYVKSKFIILYIYEEDLELGNWGGLHSTKCNPHNVANIKQLNVSCRTFLKVRVKGITHRTLYVVIYKIKTLCTIMLEYNLILTWLNMEWICVSFFSDFCYLIYKILTINQHDVITTFLVYFDSNRNRKYRKLYQNSLHLNHIDLLRTYYKQMFKWSN